MKYFKRLTDAMRRCRAPRTIDSGRIWYYVDPNGADFYGDVKFRLNRHELKRIMEIMDGGK